jgi:ATP-dependent RNA helicase DDX52/ROK1
MLSKHDRFCQMRGASLLSVGTNFSGIVNEKPKKLFKTAHQPESLGELTDYSVLEEYQVSVAGDSPPSPIQSWESLPESLQSTLTECGFARPTPAQKYTIPCILSRRNVIVVSPTGSGKTLAYVLPLLQLLASLPAHQLSAVVLLPTRELASQVFRQFRRFSATNTARVQLLRKNRDCPKCQILVGTPKRLLLAEPSLDAVEFVVIDEADHLLSHSFVQQTDDVLAKLPVNKFQVSLLSATLNSNIEESARSFLTNPIRIQIGDEHAVAALIRQELKFVGKERGKILEIQQRLDAGTLPLPVIIFVMNRRRAVDLVGELGYPSAVLTSEQSDSERADAIRQIRTGEVQILITTDLGGRGIDLAAVQTVINFDLPPDSTTYIHRIGRTARAGRSGNALTLFTVEDQPNLKPVASIMKKHGFPVDEWMLANPDKAHRGARALYEQTPRRGISSKLWKNAKVRNPPPKLPPTVD